MDNFLSKPLDILYARVDTMAMETTTHTSKEVPMDQHISGDIFAAPASQEGALAHFASICSCGFEIRSTIKVDVARDANYHVAYMAAKAQGTKALRAFVLGKVR